MALRLLNPFAQRMLTVPAAAPRPPSTDRETLQADIRQTEASPFLLRAFQRMPARNCYP